MIVLSLLLALGAAADTVPLADSLTYATPALRALVNGAAEINRRVPPGLGGYEARLESEISIGNRRSEGKEMSVSLEQVASRLTWDRTGRYEQTIVGYRSQSIGAAFASIGFFRSGWAIPSLYGNRLALLFGRDTSEARRRRSRNRGEPLFAVHPLADDREKFYRYTGGDTIITMRVNDREIPIVRVLVSLRPEVPAKSVVFLGEMDLDASRHHIVRLRGYFAVVGGPKPKFDILRDLGLQGVAYVEAVNAEAEGQFWLPAHQRFEAVASANTVGEGRAIFRILTRFVDREILPVPEGVEVGAANDTLSIRPFRLAIESPDTLSGYKGWRTELGEMTAAVSAEDFSDVAPNRWNPRGPPRFALETQRLGDVIRVDRIEGLFTGIGAVMRYRDAAPGLTMRAAVGWAWNEQTARGRFTTEYRRGRSQWAALATRSLDLTNDFRSPFDSGSTLAAIMGRDNYDYVDRRSLMGQWLRFVGDRERAQLRVETGVAEDRGASVHLARSPLGIGSDFRPNRIVQDGRYTRSAVTLDVRPDVSLEFLRTGTGVRLYYERGDGELNYQRAEGRFTVRSNRGPFSLGARLDVGVTTPDAPPQQFFELGQNQNLPGYELQGVRGRSGGRLPAPRAAAIAVVGRADTDHAAPLAPARRACIGAWRSGRVDARLDPDSACDHHCARIRSHGTSARVGEPDAADPRRRGRRSGSRRRSTTPVGCDGSSSSDSDHDAPTPQTRSDRRVHRGLGRRRRVSQRSRSRMRGHRTIDSRLTPRARIPQRSLRCRTRSFPCSTSARSLQRRCWIRSRWASACSSASVVPWSCAGDCSCDSRTPPRSCSTPLRTRRAVRSSMWSSFVACRGAVSAR